MKQARGTATQHDVAQRAKVSQAAVSRVFADKGYVAAEVRERIIRAAGELGYRPNALARGLITGHSNIIAVVMADIVNPFYPVVLDALTRAIQRRGRQVLLFNAAHDQSVDDLIPSVLQYGVKGIVVTTASLSSQAADLCAQKGVPVVLINRYAASRRANAVCCDNVLGGRQAAALLSRAGCRRLAYVGGLASSSTSKDRKAGFCDALAEQGLAPVAVVEQAFTYDWGRRAANELLALDPGIDGIFCGDDAIAFGVLDTLRYGLGRRVPDQVSIIGFDDIPSAAWSAYDLTTIRQPLEAMVEKTLELIEAEEPPAPAMHLLPGEIVLRGTLRPISG